MTFLVLLVSVGGDGGFGLFACSRFRSQFGLTLGSL